MKKSLNISVVLLFAFTFFTLTKAYTQVGIGTTNPNQASLLELNSSNKGLLIPRVALISTTNALPLSAHVAGMMVYNTVFTPPSETSVSPGFYYNNGTMWIKAGDASAGDQTDDAWINDAVAGYVHLNTLSDGATARPEGSEVVFTDSGRLGIGTSNPTESIQVKAENADLDMYSFGNQVSIFHIHAAGGTLAAPSAVSSRNTFNIFSLEARAFDGAFYRRAASIAFAVDGFSGINNMPGKITFNTAPAGSTVQQQRMVIKNNGTVGIGNFNPSTRVSLDVNGMIKTKAYTVAELLALTPVEGAMAYVTDALDPSYLQAVAGGGSVKCPVFYNGTTWVCH